MTHHLKNSSIGYQFFSKYPLHHNDSFLKCGRGRWSNLSWIVFQILKKSFLTPSKYKTYKLQKWLQYFLVSEWLRFQAVTPSWWSHAGTIPHPVVEPECCLVINSDGVIRSIPNLGVLIIQGKEVVTKRRDT